MVNPSKNGSATAELERLKKFFPKVVLSKISVPATIVDKHGKILVVHLPDILTASHIEHLNHITGGLRESLLKTVNPKDVNTSWRDDGYMVPAEGGEFGAGRITVAPAYFMQRQEQQVDPLVTSESYKSQKVQQ
ncbi:hypothetical protein BD769DRAFT_1669528 [Suillus cothurnatus]|nr:hypothetical protein BD769DRAFT_1669528 [Suillus cothurnatus]